MSSLEQEIKNQFAKVFDSSDWQLFKKVAEINLAEAALLKKASFKVDKNMQLLVRNSRKRLLIGIGSELLLKALYLKLGYSINKLLDSRGGPKPPYKLSGIDCGLLDPRDTFTLAQLTEQLKKIIELPQPNIVLNGLRIAKVFRNKEGHVVTQSHMFVETNYREIESALVEVYTHAFGEKLTVRFSIAYGDKGVWHVEA